MWIIIGSVATVIALFFIALAIYNEYKWAKQGGSGTNSVGIEKILLSIKLLLLRHNNFMVRNKLNVGLAGLVIFALGVIIFFIGIFTPLWLVTMVVGAGLGIGGYLMLYSIALK